MKNSTGGNHAKNAAFLIISFLTFLAFDVEIPVFVHLIELKFLNKR